MRRQAAPMFPKNIRFFLSSTSRRSRHMMRVACHAAASVGRSLSHVIESHQRQLIRTIAARLSRVDGGIGVRAGYRWPRPPA